MAARDLYHDAVKSALIKDGWVITADPYFIRYENTELYADLCVVDDLLAAGVPKQDIVLGFHHPSKRPLTEFAIT
jgi:hypothetical protein